MDIKDIQGNIILSVSVSRECEHVEELMKSDYIQLSWNSSSRDILPAGSYIEYKGEKYSLLEPYSPTQKDELEFTYQPQFQSKIMIWGKTPFFMYTYADDTISNREPDWSLTDNPANFMSVVVDAIKNETGETWTYSVADSLPASTSLSFQTTDIFSALNQIANAFETEWWVDKINKVIHLSKASHGETVALEVGNNVKTPSVTYGKEGYYTRFYAFGSTRNIVQDYKGSNVNNLVNKRLTLDPDKYPGGYKDIQDNLSSDEIFSKVLIFDDIYPSSQLKISDVRMRLMWTLDSEGNKVQVGTNEEGAPIYDQYAIWYFQIPDFIFDNTIYDKDANPQGMLISGKKLSVHFQDGPLSGREFELNYHDKSEAVSSADGTPIQIKEGDYEILFVKEDSLVIPMINNLVPVDGNEIILFNIRMPEEYTASAYLELEATLSREMERMSSDLNNYQFSSNPIAFKEYNPNLSLGRNVTYKNGNYSYPTRVIKLVTKLDFEIEQTITVGNEQIKGNTQEIKEEVASANEDINLLAILNSTTNSLTQAYNRTQQLMLEGFASIKDMWKFDPNNADTIYSKYNVYSEKALSAKGLALGSGGGSGEGGATALYQLNDVAKNASETGVIGAGPGKVLTYGNDGKWYAADAVGLDETALGKYLTDNNYAQKSDIPSLSGYATQSWVLGKNYITSDALSGYATQSWVNSQGYATASSLKDVSDKLNDFLEGSDTDGIINKWKELEAFLAGQTQTSTLADLLAVKADKATTLSGYGITDAYTKTEVNTKLGSYVTTTALNTALAKKVDVAFLAKVFGFIGEDSLEVTINDMGSVITSIKAKFGLWTDEYLSSKGLNPNAGGGSGEGATALYQLNDVSQNASGTGVLGAEAGKVLTYGSDGKWYAAKAGMDEDALSSYLTENNYAQKSDIPSLNGYATQSWVNTALEKKVDKVSGMGLSHNDFTDTLLQKLNGIAEGANKYVLPIAKAAVLGGVMIGSTLTASATGVLDLPEVAIAGTYAKVTTDVYGRVTAGSSLSASDIPALSISKITGLQAALDDKVNKADFVTEFDKAMQRWFVRDTANKGLHPADYDSEAVGIYSDSYMSAKGVNTGAGGSAGGASSLGELNNVGSWADDIPTVDRIMVQRKGETHWENLNLSDIGLNETQLSDYLTTNNYAKKSDIPSLSGYATQAWVNTKLADYATTSSVTTLLAEKVDKVEGKGLSANDFTDTLLNKLNGIEAGANKYVLPTASASVLGGVKVGTTLAISSGVLNLKAVGTAGTYFKTTTDAYGRVTAGSNPTTLAGFGITDGVNDVAYSGSGNAVTSATVSGHIITLVKGTTFLTKATFDDLFEKVNIGTASAPVYAIKAKYGLYTEQFLSSMGLNLGTGSGGGSDYDRLDTWADYDASKAGWVLSAGLGNDLNTRVTSLENGAAVTVTPSGSGTVVKDVTKNGTVITVTKGDLAFGSLTGKPTTISGYGITDAYTKTQADAKYVTLDTDQTITATKVFKDPDLRGALHVWRNGDGLTSLVSFYSGATTKTLLGSIGFVTANVPMFYKTTNNAVNLLHAENYTSYTVTKTGTGASGTWGINVNGYAHRLHQALGNKTAEQVFTDNGVYYYQVSSAEDTGYPTDYGHGLMLQRSSGATLTSSQAVLDIFTPTSGTNLVYLRTGIGNGTKITWQAFQQILHTGNYTSLITKLGTATVGSNTKFFYLNAGTPTASTATVGSSSLPVYMNAGTITQCSTTLGVSVTGYSKRLLETVLTNEDLDTYTYSSYSGKTYSAGGGNTVANKPEGVDSFGLLVLRSAGGYTTHLAVNGANLFSRYHNSTTWSDWYKFAFVTSNVASATKLQTARTINGTSFDGTANITTAKWGTARTLAIAAASKSIDGSTNITISRADMNVSAGDESIFTGTTVANTWYRIASSPANISSITGIFSIYASASEYHTNCLLTVSTSYGNTASTSIQQLSCAHYGNPLITQARIVYHTTYDAHYAYLEILVPTAITSTFVVRFSLPGQNFWALNTSLVAGSIPSGYTSKAITLKNSCIVANVTGNLTGNVTGNLTGNASTATSLQTARTLWGQSFNGTANITGTLLGVESLVARSGRINNFSGYLDNSGNPATGTICITLPNGWTSSMNIYEIWIYEYNTTANASVITIGAYNYNGGGTASSAKWINIGYHTKGAYSKGVRLAYNGSKCVILLGTTATTWSYPKVYLKTIYTGHSNQTIWGGTSTISLITSETGYTNIDTPARMDEFFGDTSVTGRLAVTGAGHFGYTYTTMTAGINVKGDSATTGISIYDGTGSTARLYRKGDILYITRGGNDNAGLLMSTAGSIYPGANNTLTNGTTTNRWSGVYTQLLNVAGAATFSSTITASGEIRSGAANAFRAVNTKASFIIRNDGSSTYFLLTDADKPYDTYNSLRPLYINNSTGVVTMSNGTNIGGILNVTNTTDATTTTAAAIKTAGGLAVAKQLRVGGAATLSSSLYVTGSATFMGGIRIGDYWLRSTADGLELSHATSGKTAGLYTTGFLSSMGLNPGTGEGGSGSDYDRLDAWDDYSADKAGYVLSAKLGNDLNTRVKSLEGGSALTVTTTGSGNAVTSVAKSGTAITVTKGTTFVDLASAQTITGQKTWTVSQRMANTSIHRVNNASGGNATGSYWYTANYAAIQFGIGLYTDSNASPRAYIGWTSTPWIVSTNLTVSETQLTYKAKNILHAGNYNDYAPTKTGGGASGSWGISITGNAATATTSSMLTVKDVRGESRLPSYFEEKRVTAWFNNTGNPASNWFSGIHVKGWTDTYMSWELATYSDVTSTTNSSLYYRNGLGSTWHAWRTIVDSHNYTSYVLKIGTATVGGTAKPIYLNAGTPTALSSTVGDSTVPAYLNAGTVTACSWGLIGTTGKRVRKSGYITSGTSGLSSYWGKIASFDWGDASGERDIALYIHSAFNSLWGTVVIRTRWSSATSTIIDFRIINGNIPTSRLRLYYDVSAKDNVITLWGDVNAQWGAFNTYVLSETTRTSSETGDVTLYTTSFTTAQTLPTSTYKTPTYLSILNNADTATTLQTSRTIFGKSFNGSANVAGQALVYGTYQETASSRYSNGGLQIRENGMVGSAQTADGYAPAIGFHWANRIGASLILTTSGFKFMNQAFTGYQNVYGIFKGNADSATQVYSTLTNPTTGTWYVIPFHTGASTTNKLLLNNNGIQYYSLEGTASAQGEALIQIGNSTATGTAGNKRGRLRLYSSSSGWADFTLTATTGNYTLTLPAATGTVALTSSNVASATKLQTARTLWGQSFNGTANVSGSMTGVGPNIVAAANITMTTTGEGNNLSLKYNNDDTKSVVLNTSAFKPFDLATNKLNLGTSAARWLGVYANTGNFSSTVTGTRFISTVATGTAPLTVSSTTVVTNLNADMVDGIHSSNIPLEYDASYTPTGTTARWLRIAYFDYSSASYSWSGTFAITNTYVNDENKGLIFTVSTAHGTTSPVITQIGGASGVFTSIRIVKDTTTVYPTTAKVYLEVYYNSTSAANNVYVSYKPANRAIGKWTLYTTYTAGSIPTGHTAIAQLYTTSGLSTTANLRVQGTAVILGATNHNDRLDIQSDGKIVPHSTATRRSGVYGVYDAAKIGHIWSMGTSYMIADDGSGFGNLYGFAYQYSASDRATVHQAVWCVNGAPKVALGNNFWVASSATIGGTLTVTGTGSVSTLTLKSTEAVGHIKFSRGNFNYITAPASGIIAFVVNGQGVGDTTSELIIQDGALRAGTTNVTSLGQEAKRWSNMYSVLLNVSGVATLSSTVNIAGVLNANNATDATSTTAAGAVFDGGVGIAKQLRVGGTSTFSGTINTSVATFINLGANATDQKILKDVDGNGFYSGISFFGTKGSNMGVSDIMMNIYAGGAIQIHSQAGSGQILLNGTVHNNVGMYSDGYMSSKGLNDTSDMRLKNKGRDIFLSVKDMAHAPAFEYTWKDGTPGVMAGSSAQYWQKVLPPSVKIKKDGYMTMFYGHTALVATISLARHVETLEERVERLERENKEKDKRIKELERRISA